MWRLSFTSNEIKILVTFSVSLCILPQSVKCLYLVKESIDIRKWFNNETCRPAQGITYSAGTVGGRAEQPKHGHSRVFTQEQTIYIQAIEGKKVVIELYEHFPSTVSYIFIVNVFNLLLFTRFLF